MELSFVVTIFVFCGTFSSSFGYCPTCEQNNNFMSLMNSIRAGNTNNNNNNGGMNYMGNGYGSIGSSSNNYNIEGYGNSGGSSNTQWPQQQSSYGNNNGFGGSATYGNNYGVSNGVPNTNGFGMNTFSTNNNNNNNFNAVPVRIFTTNGYGCCNQVFGPCCSGTNTFNSFLPNHSSFGGVQANPSNDVPHASYTPSQPLSSPPSPTYDYTNTVQNNVPFTGPATTKQNDAATIASATFDFYPQQHVNNNQHNPSATTYHQPSLQQQQPQEALYYKNPYGSAAF